MALVGGQAYLRPALRRRNCRLVRGARAEVIVAASPINSPKLLMQSGLGPARHLAEHGIDVIADRPGVGQNLQDHLGLYVQQAARRPVSLYRHRNLWGKALIGAQWLLTRRGIGASNQFESAGFARSAAGIDYPDVQFHFLPMAVPHDGQMAAEGHGFQTHVGPMRSASLGAVTLRKPDPEAPPRIAFNYMSTEADWRDFRTCIRLTREIFDQDAFAPYRGVKFQPGAAA